MCSHGLCIILCIDAQVNNNKQSTSKQTSRRADGTWLKKACIADADRRVSDKQFKRNRHTTNKKLDE